MEDSIFGEAVIDLEYDPGDPPQSSQPQTEASTRLLYLQLMIDNEHKPSHG